MWCLSEKALCEVCLGSKQHIVKSGYTSYTKKKQKYKAKSFMPQTPGTKNVEFPRMVHQRLKTYKYTFVEIVELIFCHNATYETQ